MQQYVDLKKDYPGCILFYRLGDFYEMFFEDAERVSRELELTLTGKSCGLKERAPMCGVPFHAVEGYLNRLIGKGYKVAICEQVEDPKDAKGLVRREVVRVVTPGTNMDAGALDEGKNNYLLCIYYNGKGYGVAASDVSTGEFLLMEKDSKEEILNVISQLSPSEILVNDPFLMCGLAPGDIEKRFHVRPETLSANHFDDVLSRETLLEHFGASSLKGLGIDPYPLGVYASGALLKYLQETQMNDLSHITGIKVCHTGDTMILDATAMRNLELTETLREKRKKGSLLYVLDKTKTAMGARLLRKYVEQPLISRERIENRLDSVEVLMGNIIVREEIREYLNTVYDLERLMSRITYESANPRDLSAFKNSLEMLPAIRLLLSDLAGEDLKEIHTDMDPLTDLFDLIENAIIDEPPLAMKEGGIIKTGYMEKVDTLREAKTKGREWLAALEDEERRKTGIKKLRIKYNKVFGYYLEVTNSYKDLVPERYERKQTLANCERYTIPELKEMEETILGAEEKLCALEYEIFADVRRHIGDEVTRIQRTAHAIARLDVLASLALVAEENRYVRPQINEKGVIDIKGGRHPVVETMTGGDRFIANDTHLDDRKKRVSIITGPNMAGKSTYMRQSALIVLMAQMGSFVPADQANIGIVDRIFTRVGASDDLASGQSTFMVEMTEVANILRNATSRSLLILDEIGRGTSTYDGLSIAWAVVEYISSAKCLGAKTLFATHYHELTELEGKIGNVNNYCITVKENGEDIVFLRKIVKGGADKSYGIQVARLAGVPESVIRRSEEIAAELEKNDITEGCAFIPPRVEPPKPKQLSLFDAQTDPVLEKLKSLNVAEMTPMEAMNALYALQNSVLER